MKVYGRVGILTNIFSVDQNSLGRTPPPFSTRFTLTGACSFWVYYTFYTSWLRTIDITKSCHAHQIKLFTTKMARYGIDRLCPTKWSLYRFQCFQCPHTNCQWPRDVQRGPSLMTKPDLYRDDLLWSEKLDPDGSYWTYDIRWQCMADNVIVHAMLTILVRSSGHPPHRNNKKEDSNLIHTIPPPPPVISVINTWLYLWFISRIL